MWRHCPVSSGHQLLRWSPPWPSCHPAMSQTWDLEERTNHEKGVSQIAFVCLKMPPGGGHTNPHYLFSEAAFPQFCFCCQEKLWPWGDVTQMWVFLMEVLNSLLVMLMFRRGGTWISLGIPNPYPLWQRPPVNYHWTLQHHWDRTENAIKFPILKHHHIKLWFGIKHEQHHSFFSKHLFVVHAVLILFMLYEWMFYFREQTLPLSTLSYPRLWLFCMYICMSICIYPSIHPSSSEGTRLFFFKTKITIVTTRSSFYIIPKLEPIVSCLLTQIIHSVDFLRGWADLWTLTLPFHNSQFLQGQPGTRHCNRWEVALKNIDGRCTKLTFYSFWQKERTP